MAASCACAASVRSNAIKLFAKATVASVLAIPLCGCLLAVPVAVGVAGEVTAAKTLHDQSAEKKDPQAQYRMAAATALHVKPDDIDEIQISKTGFRKEWQVKVGKDSAAYHCTGLGTPVHDATCQPS